ncbi:heme-binding protein 2-like [Rhinoderma darwinii]|uniref:heme-binding protein 2-like n=1 Tax=Rhinoderma darwinii TaxID=43563 RepID=UPI003F67680E
MKPYTDMEARSALLLGLLSVLGIAVTEQASVASNQNQSPSFCGTRDCPRYQLVKQYDNFEHRDYEETRWVTTSLKQDMIGIGMVISFRRLFSYITGKNAEGLNINMTVPVVINIPSKQQTAGNSTMCFFVPHEVENPPAPTDPAVYLETFASASVYVKTFGGYALDFMYAKQAKTLAEELRAHGLTFDDTYFLRVGYNDPFTFLNRHNEVWYIAK